MQTIAPQPGTEQTPAAAAPSRRKLIARPFIPKLFPTKRRARRRWRDYVGVALATLGATILAFVAFWELFRSDNDPLSWLAILGMGTLSVITGILSTLPAILSAQASSSARKEHDALKDRLAPTLFAGMEEIVDRWSTFLLPGLQLDADIEVDDGLQLELHVFLRIDGHYRIVASSAEPYSNVRRLKLAENEGLIHLVFARNTAVVARLEEDFRAKLLNPHGKEIADQPPLRDTNAEKCNPDVRWIYATPIFDTLKHRPWSDRCLGVLSVDGLHSASGNIFLKPEFRDLVEAVALQLAPYLSACESLRVLPAMPPEE